MKNIIGCVVVTLLITTAIPAVGMLNTQFHGLDLVDKPVSGGWYKTYGGDGVDGFEGLVVASDGSYILSGTTEIDGTKDAWIVKIDTDGDIIWETTYGTTDGLDAFVSVIETSDGGYLAVGLYTNGDTDEQQHYDGLLVKTDADGNIVWANTYGGEKKEELYSVHETDTGYLAVGLSKSYSTAISDGFLVKTDFDGNIEWFKILEKDGYSGDFVSITAANDAGGYILSGGYYSSIEPPHGRLVKIDDDGNILWDNSYGPLLFYDWCTAVANTHDNNYIVTGGTMADPFGLGLWGTDVWLMKVDNDGNLIWEQRHGVPFFKDYSLCVQPTDDGGYVFTGHTLGIGKFGRVAFAAWSKMWLVKTDAEGDIEWEKRLPGDGHCRTVRELPDGYILCGYVGDGNVGNSEHAVLIKTDKNGNIN